MRIFGIGMPKTGTNALCEALRLLGRESVEHEYTDPQRADAPTDCIGLIPYTYADLYASEPDSLFILTLRPTHTWIRSIREFQRTASNPTPAMTRIFGTDTPSDDHCIRTYQAHSWAVRDFFTRRNPDVLCILHIGDDSHEPMHKLASYINPESPWRDGPFPRLG